MKRFLLAAVAGTALFACGELRAGTLICNNGGLVGQQDCTIGSGLSLSAGGVLSSTVSGGTPGGSNGQLQINSTGSFAGITLGGDCTFSSPNVTCTKTGGVSFAASATTDTTSATNITAGTLPNTRLSAVPLSAIATETANTVVANVTASTAAPTAASLPSCIDSSGNHLNYTNGTGFSCGTSSSGSSGAMTKVGSTLTASNSATLDFTGLGSTYNTYLLDCNGLRPVSDNVSLQMLFSEATVFQTAGYSYSVQGLGANSAGGTSVTQQAGSNSAAQINLSDAGSQGGTQDTGFNQGVWLTISNIASTTQYKTVMGNWMSMGSAVFGTGGSLVASFHGDKTTAVDGFRIKYSSGNISVGQCSLYGITP